MTINEERELFLIALKNHFQTTNAKITKEKVYSLLVNSYINEGKIKLKKKESYVNIQLHLNEKFKNEDKINTFTAPYPTNDFLIIENRVGDKDKNFKEELMDSTKLYIASDITNIYDLSSKIIKYIIKENIKAQIKIAKHSRTDAFTIRVIGVKETNKLVEYINSRDYQKGTKPNPFSLEIGRVNMTKDGRKSYNGRLSYYISEYLKEVKEEVSLSSFTTYMHTQISKIPKTDKDEYMIVEIIIKNLEGTLTKEKLQAYKVNSTTENREEILEEDKTNILRLINKLNIYYSLDETHGRMEQYINKKDINIFTRQNGIRRFVEDNISPTKMKAVLHEMGYNALLDAIEETLKKYDIKQVEKAIEEILTKEEISSLTNDNDVRSYLGFIISPKELRRILLEKISPSITQEDITNINKLINITLDKTLKEIELRNISKRNGRN